MLMVHAGTGKTGKMGDHFPVREKSGTFDQTGKVSEFYPKYLENREIFTLENGNKYLKSQEIWQSEK